MSTTRQQRRFLSALRRGTGYRPASVALERWLKDPEFAGELVRVSIAHRVLSSTTAALPKELLAVIARHCGRGDEATEAAADDQDVGGLCAPGLPAAERDELIERMLAREAAQDEPG